MYVSNDTKIGGGTHVSNVAKTREKLKYVYSDAKTGKQLM